MPLLFSPYCDHFSPTMQKPNWCPTLEITAVHLSIFPRGFIRPGLLSFQVFFSRLPEFPRGWICVGPLSFGVGYSSLFSLATWLCIFTCPEIPHRTLKWPSKGFMVSLLWFCFGFPFCGRVPLRRRDKVNMGGNFLRG